MNIDNVTWVGIVFLLFGTWLLVWRFIHYTFLGEFWNNMPIYLTWSFTMIAVGVSAFLALFFYVGDECPDKCKRSGEDSIGGIVTAAAFLTVAGTISIFWCKTKKVLRYDWGDDDTKPYDQRPAYSGIDIAGFLMGVAILVTAARIGTCPASCGVAVIATPPPTT